MLQKLICSDSKVTITEHATNGDPQEDREHAASIEVFYCPQDRTLSYRFCALLFGTEQTFELTLDRLENLLGITTIDEFLNNDENEHGDLLDYLTENDLQQWQYWE